MKRIILFRFHKEFEVCKNKIELLRRFNPHIKIYGLYGGVEDEFSEVDRVLGKRMDHIYIIRGKSADWKWLNGDLTIRMWYQDYGKDLDFDIVHIIEWDMLVLAPIEEIYGHIPKDAIGLTGLVPLKEVEDRWDWTSVERLKVRWKKLLTIAKEKFNYDKEPFACLAGGACLSKKFLTKYSEIDVPELSNDELRMPLFAQIFGIKIYDTGFYKKWFDEEEEKYFTAHKKEVKLELIKKEFANPKGRRVLHPYRKVLGI